MGGPPCGATLERSNSLVIRGPLALMEGCVTWLVYRLDRLRQQGFV